MSVLPEPQEGRLSRARESAGPVWIAGSMSGDLPEPVPDAALRSAQGGNGRLVPGPL